MKNTEALEMQNVRLQIVIDIIACFDSFSGCSHVH
jgi:hypothetical protein